MPIIKVIKYFNILQSMKNDLRLNMSHGKCQILFHFHCLRSLYLQTEKFWSLKYMSSHLNMSHGKMSDFVLFPLLRFTLVIKLGNFDFESNWNSLIFFLSKQWYQIWLCPVKPCLIWFKLCCLSIVLRISWEIRIF